MNINKYGRIVEGEISDEAQTRYNLKVVFLTKPIKNYQQLIDLAEMNNDSEEFTNSVREKFKLALGLNIHSEDFIKNLLDPTRIILYKYYMEKLKKND